MAVSTNVDNKRYRGLIISIALFLSLIGALLAFTFYTSSLLEKNTILIDQTNQVANSAQAVIKDLFDQEVGKNRYNTQCLNQTNSAGLTLCIIKYLISQIF